MANLNKRNNHTPGQESEKEQENRGQRDQEGGKPGRKLSEYGRQLQEKQKVKEMYGLRERQFRRFFANAVKAAVGTPGDNLLSFLERRLDNTVYRLKLTTSRAQARQIVTHGHVLVNGKKVYSPSYLVTINDVVALDNKSLERQGFLEQVIDKRLKIGIKVPDWLELNKQDRTGRILRLPVRTDVQVPIEDHLIVELYSK
jgi:small subunit ribosomal protein S4